jgi:hypothetical protein
MAYGDIPDLVFTVDSQGNVVYTSANATANGSTGNTGGDTGSTDKKWWEQLFGVIPGILNAILGSKAQGQTQVPVGSYPQTPSASMNNGNMTIIVVAAAIIIFLLLKKK